jgi:hypothetical protein
MKFIVVTSVANHQQVYIPLKRISSIRYPSATGKTLITWSETDGSINYENVEEKPGGIPLISNTKARCI